MLYLIDINNNDNFDIN